MLYYGLGIGLFIYFSLKNGYLVLDFRQSVFLFLTLSLVLLQMFLKSKNIESKVLIVIQILVLLAYFFPQYFTFLEKINPYNLRRLVRRYKKFRIYADEKFKDFMENMNKKKIEEDELTVASTADIDEEEIEEMRKMLEKKEEKLKRRKKRKEAQLKLKNEEDENEIPKFKRRNRKRKISNKVKFNETPSQVEIESMIENIASVFAKNNQ